jgi:exodeoxyribonuclease VII large subunit
VHLILRPTRVQGDGAAAEIADAIRSISRLPEVDVVIVGRGGGSAEDLLPFNLEPVARAIAGSRVPIVSAVGHEVDFTIADFVADVRAPTPSAAAEMVISAQEELRVRIDRQTRRLRGAVTASLERRRSRVHVLSSRRGLAGFAARLALRGRHVAELTHQLQQGMSSLLARRDREFRSLRLRLEARDLRRRFAAMRGKLATADGQLQAVIRRRHDRAQARLGSLVARLESLSPLAVLGRGYSVCWNEDHTAIVRSASSVRQGDRIHVTLQDGALDCDVRAAHTPDASRPERS